MTAAPVAAVAAPRGGYAKGRARRRQIVHTAGHHFADRGFSGATILDIATACNITRAGLLHYFPNKEALLEAVLEDRDTADHDRFTPYLGIRGGIGVLRGIVDLADHNRLTPGLIELFVRLASEARDVDHPAHRYFLDRYARIRTGTARALNAAEHNGYLRSGVDPADAAVRLTALMDGLQSQWLLSPELNMSSHLRCAILELLTPRGAHAFDAAGNCAGGPGPNHSGD